MPQTDYAPSLKDVLVTTGSANNASVVVSLAPTRPGATAFLEGFMVGGFGATSSVTVTCVVTGLLGGTPATFPYAVPGGTTVVATPLVQTFPAALPASGPTTSVTVTVGAFGAGSTSTTVTIFGYQF